jgi:hypothetical protein
LAIEGAVFIRYTDVAELVVAVAAVIVYYRRARFSVAMVATWLGSVVLFGAFDLAFNAWAYGSATSTGYDAGEITFSFSAFWPNLKLMPAQLSSSMPVWIVAAIAVLWIVTRWVRRRHSTTLARVEAQRDFAVAGALVVGWLAMWILYFTYTWTAQMAGNGPGGGSDTVHLIRFYLPVLGLIVLLATWLLSKLTALLSGGVLFALLVASLFSFYAMAGSGIAAGRPNNAPGGTPAYGPVQISPGGPPYGPPRSGGRPRRHHGGSPPA